MKSDQDPRLSSDSPYEEMHIPYLPLPSDSLQQPASQPSVAAAHTTPLMSNSMRENVRTRGVIAPRSKLLVSVSVILFLVVLLSVSVIGGVAVYNTHMSQVHTDALATASTRVEATDTATVIAANPYGGTLVLNDPLRDNSLGHWYQGSDSVSSCEFTGGA